jgi:cell division protease FtsH
MSDAIGPMTFGQKREEIFIGRDLGMHRDFSEEMARRIDDEVRRIIEHAHNRAYRIVKSNRDVLDAISKLLLEKESLDATELDKLIPKGLQEAKHSDGERKRSNRPPRRRGPRKPRNEGQPREGQVAAESGDKQPTQENETPAGDNQQQQTQPGQPQGDVFTPSTDSADKPAEQKVEKSDESTSANDSENRDDS